MLTCAPEKAMFGGYRQSTKAKNTIRQYIRKNTRERKSGSSPKRFSGRLRFALAFCSALLFCSGVVIDKHTPRCQIHKFSRSRYKLNIYCSTLFFFKQRNRLFNVRLRTSFRNMYVKIFDCSATSNIIDSYKFI